MFLVKLARDLTRPKNPPNGGGDCKGNPQKFQGNRVVGETLVFQIPYE